MALEKIYRGMQNSAEVIEKNFTTLADEVGQTKATTKLKSEVVWTGASYLSSSQIYGYNPNKRTNIQNVVLIFSRFDGEAKDYGFQIFTIPTEIVKSKGVWLPLIYLAANPALKSIVIDHTNQTVAGNDHNQTDTASRFFVLRSISIQYYE